MNDVVKESEMVERVAKAIAAANCEGHPWVEWTQEARAAIAAMRDPTEQYRQYAEGEIWGEMIDAILADADAALEPVDDGVWTNEGKP